MVPLDEGSRRAQESDMYEEVQRMEVDPRATSMSYREDPKLLCAVYKTDDSSMTNICAKLMLTRECPTRCRLLFEMRTWSN